jgi:hypothetical protein
MTVRFYSNTPQMHLGEAHNRRLLTEPGTVADGSVQFTEPPQKTNCLMATSVWMNRLVQRMRIKRGAKTEEETVQSTNLSSCACLRCLPRRKLILCLSSSLSNSYT